MAPAVYNTCDTMVQLASGSSKSQRSPCVLATLIGSTVVAVLVGWSSLPRRSVCLAIGSFNEDTLKKNNRILAHVNTEQPSSIRNHVNTEPSQTTTNKTNQPTTGNVKNKQTNN